MGKASITMKYSLTANGILDITDTGMYIENPDTGEAVSLQDLLFDFADKGIRISVTYDEDYNSNE